MINSRVLMSGVEYFSDNAAINPYMDASIPVHIERAAEEHAAIRAALEMSGVEVVHVKPPKDCQDGVYTANWALVHGEKAVMSRLPNARKLEEPFAEQELRKLGKKIIHVPDTLRFSGQGDALVCGNLLFTGSVYRTDIAVHEFLGHEFGLRVVSLQTVPSIENGTEVTNAHSGWPDSFFYDIDLAIAIIRDDLIAWCPEAFMTESQDTMRALGGVKKIEVTLEEAMQNFACNLVSTGETVVMNAGATELQKALQEEGLEIITLSNPELAKGGGSIRCTTLSV